MGKATIIPFKKKVAAQKELTEREWKELMGTDRDTYIRHKGSIRRK